MFYLKLLTIHCLPHYCVETANKIIANDTKNKDYNKKKYQKNEQNTTLNETNITKMYAEQKNLFIKC